MQHESGSSGESSCTGLRAAGDHLPWGTVLARVPNLELSDMDRMHDGEWHQNLNGVHPLVSCDFHGDRQLRSWLLTQLLVASAGSPTRMI